MTRASDKTRVLIVGRTPPPHLGAPIMTEFLLRTPMRGIETRHIQLTLSSENDQAGRFGWTKLVRLAAFILRVIYQRVVFRPHVLYYTPELVKPRTTVLRDAAILAATRWCFPKTVLHLHASGHRAIYEQMPAWQKWLVRRGFFGAEGVIRLSRLTPDDAVFLQARREYIVANGIADPYPEHAPKAHHASSDREPVRILFVSHMCEAKGLLVLLDACGELAQRGIDFHLDLMGPVESEEFKARAQTKINDVQIADRVSFLGILTGDAKFSVYTQSDIHCHPTYYDTFPLVLLEAMAASLPVVSTYHSGIPDIVDDGETGFLVEPRNAPALAELLAELAADPGLRARMGAAGRQKFLQEFTLDRHGEQMREVFLDIAGVQMIRERVRTAEAAPESGAKTEDLVAV